jgi:hypothetical protein
VLDEIYSHAAADAAVANAARAFAGSASSMAMQPLGATVLALPPPPGAANTATAAATGSNPFAA